MLMLEGLYTTPCSRMAVSSVAECDAGASSSARGAATVFWFFVLSSFSAAAARAAAAGVRILLGLAIPLITCRSAVRHTIVERLRTEE